MPNIIYEGIICAGYWHSSKSVHPGDAGCPLIAIKNGEVELIGILISLAGEINREYYSDSAPALYVRISFYKRWIEEKIKHG